jgi:hypothetical protein
VGSAWLAMQKVAGGNGVDKTLRGVDQSKDSTWRKEDTQRKIEDCWLISRGGKVYQIKVRFY